MGKTEVGLWFAGPGWKEGLPHLRGLDLLPIGAIGGGKGPVDPTTGNGLGNWQRCAPYTPEQVAGFNGHVTGCGLRTGNGIVVFDIDGQTAVEWLQARGLDPYAAPTWQVHRTTDPHRFKLIWRLSPEQLAQFPATKLLLRTKAQDRSRGIKGEAVEVYAQPGAQVVILGPHMESGGFYGWKGTPADIATPDATWFDALIAVKEGVAALRGKGDASRPPRRNGTPSGGTWRAFGPRNPCPICGRDHSAACTHSTSSDGRELISCYYGATFTPPAGLKRLDVVTARDGSEWVYLYDYVADGIGDKALFMNHIPKSSPSMPSSQQPQQPTPADQAQQLESTIQKPATEKLQQALRQQIEDGLSGASLQSYAVSIAHEYSVDTSDVRRVVDAAIREHDASLQAAADVTALKAKLDIKQRRERITLDRVFPAHIAHSLRTVSQAVPHVDEFIAAASFLVNAASALRLGTKIAANLKSWHEPPILWLALLTESGGGKTPLFNNLIVHPRATLRKEYKDINEKLEREHLDACDKAGTAGSKKMPAPPQHVIADIEKGTMQGIFQLLEAHQKQKVALLMKPAELKSIFSSLNQFTGGQGSDKQDLLILWDGSGSPTVLATKASRIATEWLVSVIGGIQDDVLDQLMKLGDPDGLLARMLICPLIRTPIPDYSEPSAEELMEYHNAEHALKNILAELFRLEPRTYMCSLEARKRIVQLQQANERRKEQQAIKANRAVLGKRLGHIVRLAGVIHIIHIATGHTAPDAELPVETIDLAREMVDIMQEYAIQSHERLAYSSEQSIDDMMRRIHARCLNQILGPGQFRSRYLTPKQRAIYSTEAIEQYMDQLVSIGCGTWTDTPSRNGARSFSSSGSLPA